MEAGKEKGIKPQKSSAMKSRWNKRIKITNYIINLPMDFADACLVYLPEELNVNKIATIDRDFTIYRIKNKKKFELALS